MESHLAQLRIMARRRIQEEEFYKELIVERKNKLAIYLFITIIIISVSSCLDVRDTFRSKKLVSNRGEIIYINTLNWGVTDDYQYTVVSKDSNRLRERKDTIGGIGGLNPFIYKFNGDTLIIFCQEGKKMVIKENLKTIKLNYIFLENKDYIQLLSKSRLGVQGYYGVPE